jgi:hypothetical protein
MNQHALRSLALAGVAGYGVAVVKVRMVLRIEIDVALIVQPQPHLSIPSNVLDSSQVAIDDLEVMAGRGELDAISDGESLLLLSVD